MKIKLAIAVVALTMSIVGIIKAGEAFDQLANAAEQRGGGFAGAGYNADKN